MRFLKNIYFVFDIETRNSKVGYKVKCHACIQVCYEENIK